MSETNLVKIIPKCARAKNRIREHGQEMLLKDSRDGKFLVESLSTTFSLTKDFKTTWAGWFTKEEAEFQFLSNKE